MYVTLKHDKKISTKELSSRVATEKNSLKTQDQI